MACHVVQVYGWFRVGCILEWLLPWVCREARNSPLKSEILGQDMKIQLSQKLMFSQKITNMILIYTMTMLQNPPTPVCQVSFVPSLSNVGSGHSFQTHTTYLSDEHKQVWPLGIVENASSDTSPRPSSCAALSDLHFLQTSQLKEDLEMPDLICWQLNCHAKKWEKKWVFGLLALAYTLI